MELSFPEKLLGGVEQIYRVILISSFQIYLLPYDTSIEFPFDRKVWRDTAHYLLSLVFSPNKNPFLCSWDCAPFILYNRLTIGKQIGAGAYGRVLEGVAFGKILVYIIMYKCYYMNLKVLKKTSRGLLLPSRPSIHTPIKTSSSPSCQSSR